MELTDTYKVRRCARYAISLYGGMENTVRAATMYCEPGQEIQKIDTSCRWFRRLRGYEYDVFECN